VATVIRIAEGSICEHLDEVVRSKVEKALNAFLDADTDHLCGVQLFAAAMDLKTRLSGNDTDAAVNAFAPTPAL
jgi:hypothetical protein